MSGERAGEPRRRLDLNYTDRHALDLLRCGGSMADIAAIQGVTRSTVGAALYRARRRNHCATTYQLLYEYGRSLPDERAPAPAAAPCAKSSYGGRRRSHELGEDRRRLR